MAKMDDELSRLYSNNLDTKNRKIFLHSPIEQHEDPEKSVSAQIVKGLLWLDKTPGDIQLWINSPGGLVFEMFGMYDVIRQCKNKIVTIGFGEICSAAGLLLVSGDKRLATSSSMFMAHEFQIDDGDLPYFTKKARESATDKIVDMWADRLAKHTVHTKKWWLDTCKNQRELWLDATEMKKHGIIDEIYK